MTEADVPVFGTRVEGCPYVVRPGAYAVVANDDGAIAVVRTAAGCFLPGGGMEDGETPGNAARREAREECGLIVEPGKVFARAIEIVHSPRENACFEKQCAFVTARLLGSVDESEPDHELLWLDASRAIEVLTHESQRWAVARREATGEGRRAS